MTDDDVERVARKRGSLGGFAPGGYMNTCLNCDEQFTGDKRAWSCFYCALATIPTKATADDDVERACEAAWKAETKEFSTAFPWDKLHENIRIPRREYMRAALATMPTQADAYRKAADVVRKLIPTDKTGDPLLMAKKIALREALDDIEALATEGGE